MLANVFTEETFPTQANFRQIFVGSNFQNCKPKYFPRKRFLKVHSKDRNIHVTSASSQPEGCPAALQTKDPSERCWGHLIKPHCAYRQIKT